MKIEESNKLIAKFIGRCGKYNNLLYTFKGVDKIIDGDIWYSIDDAKFHNSWCWLMPVVEHINIIILNDVVATDYFDNTTYIHYHTGDLYIVSNIEQVYEEVIEFIEWYNKQKQT